MSMASEPQSRMIIPSYAFRRGFDLGRIDDRSMASWSDDRVRAALIRSGRLPSQPRGNGGADSAEEEDDLMCKETTSYNTL